MSEKCLWSIDRVYLYSYESCSGNTQMRMQADPIGTVMATKEEIDVLLDLDWNKPSIKDPFAPNYIYRPINATKLEINDIELIKSIIEDYRPAIEEYRPPAE